MLNFKLGPTNKDGKHTLIAIAPTKLSPVHLNQGLQAAIDEELFYQKAVQANPDYQRQLHGWNYVEGMPPMPANQSEYDRANVLAKSLSDTALNSLVGGFGKERGKQPVGAQRLELATDALYNASYGIDTLTAARLNYKQNAGHLNAFANHGQGATRPEQSRVNKAARETEGLEKLNALENAQEALATAVLYNKHPEAMDELFSELPHSRRESAGWEPERNKARKDVIKYRLDKL